MNRKNGFIDVNRILNSIGIEYTDIASLKNESRINNIETFFNTGIHLEFDYNGETYFYKYNENINPYNELVAEELAKDYGISCVSYDLATLNRVKGVISRNYQKKNVNYIFAKDILSDAFDGFNDGKCLNIDEYNNLDSIWAAIDYRYRGRKNKANITYHLMKQIVDIFLFDIIICQYDRHNYNWEIMEEGDNINISPLFDNERILEYREEDAFVSLSIDCVEDENLWESLEKFQQISSDEFSN